MFKYKLLTYFFISFFVLSCAKDLKVEFAETEITTPENNIVSVNIPIANGNELVSKNINSEINNHISNVLKIGDSNPQTSIESAITAFNSEYQDFKSDFSDASQIWNAQIDGEVNYQSESVICISITSYLNTGGAHGNINIFFFNFDAQTGNRIKNENLFHNFEAFKVLAKQYFDKHIKEKKSLFDPDTFRLPNNIGYGEAGIILLYNTYEIEPYAEGVIEFIIPYSEISALLVLDGA